MFLRKVQGPVYYDQHCQIKGGVRIFIYQPFTSTDLLTWKLHTPSFMEKHQALIDLMQSISKFINPPGQTADSFF
jgi:hypothetical protein